MSSEIQLDGKKYISSRRASEISEYSRDYIGELARGGLIDAKRVGGLWYVNEDSLKGYQDSEKSKNHLVSQEESKQPHEDSLNVIITFDGKDYISANRASRLSGYNQDYIGQLARSGKILSRRVSNRWYVDRAGLLAHKEEKDALLANVQSQALGITKHEAVHDGNTSTHDQDLLVYTQEEKELLPILATKAVQATTTIPIQKNQLGQKPRDIPVIPRFQEIHDKKAILKSDSAALFNYFGRKTAIFLIVLCGTFIAAHYLAGNDPLKANLNGSITRRIYDHIQTRIVPRLEWPMNFVENTFSSPLQYTRK